MNLKFQTKLTLTLLLFELIVELNAINSNTSNHFWKSQLEVEEEGDASSGSLANQDKASYVDKTLIIQGKDSVQMTSKCKKHSMSNDLTKIVIKPENQRIKKLKLMYIDKDNHNRTLEILPHYDATNFTPDLIQINIMRKNKSALHKPIQDGSKEKRFGTPETESEFMPVNKITGGNESCAKYIINVNSNVNASNIAPVYDKKDRSLPKFKFIELNKIKSKERKLHKKAPLMSSTLTWSSTSTQLPFTSSISSILLKKQVIENKARARVSVNPTVSTKAMGKMPKQLSDCESNTYNAKQGKIRKLHCSPHVHHHVPPRHYFVRKKYTHISLTTIEPETKLSSVPDTTTLKWTRKPKKAKVTKLKLTHPEAKIPVDSYMRQPDRSRSPGLYLFYLFFCFNKKKFLTNIICLFSYFSLLW